MVLATDHYELSYFSRRRVEESPWSLRWPPTEQQQREFLEKARAAPAIYAVLPDTNGKPVVEGLIEKLGMQPGEALAQVERVDRKGKPLPALTLYRLVAKPEPATSPSSRTASQTSPRD